uniref:DUF4283 domain-containing protein n=1 Tax=Cannabis sativa TaxID=3483 RepID=A0A803P9D2_CANSA
MSLELELDFELNAEVTRTGVLASFFGGRGVSRTELKEILPDIWKKLNGNWKFKTLKPDLWGIFFDLEEDCFEVLESRPWLINGKMHIIQEWPEDAKAGEYKGYDMADQRTIQRRGFLKFQTLGPSIPPKGEAVAAFGPWIKVESVVYSCFNTRNQLDCLCAANGVNPIRPIAPLSSGNVSGEPVFNLKDKGKSLLGNSNSRMETTFSPCLPKKKVITVQTNQPEKFIQDRRTKSISPSLLRFHSLGKKASDIDNEINKKYTSRPIPNPRDERVLTAIMANVGPTYKQMIESPHSDLCKSRQPHKHPEPTHFPWPIYAIEIGLTEELMGPPPIEKYEPFPTIFHDPVDVSEWPKSSKLGEAGEVHIARNLSDDLNLGLLRESAMQALRAWVQKCNPDCIFLMETKVYDERMAICARKLGYRNCACIASRGIAGGFGLIWNESVMIGNLYLDNSIIDSVLRDPNSGREWRLIATYGTPYNVEKERLMEEKSWGRQSSSFDRRHLNEFMDVTKGVDLRFRGCKYTWQNNRFTGDLPRERLDRAIGSFDWVSWYPKAGVRNFPITALDHACILLDTQMFCAKNFIPFKFFEAWTLVDSCKEVLSESWRIVGSDPATTFVANLNKDKLKEIWQKKEMEWRQKSREGLSLGHRNTRFFHASTIIRRRRNQIWVLKDNSGAPCEGKRHLTTIINGYFTKLYSTSMSQISSDLEDLFSNKINSEDNVLFISIPTSEEIRATIFELHPLKVPGPNGFSGCFFHMFWIVVGDNVYEVDHPDHIDQFRPISLRNFSYKIIAKILTDRLTRVMDDLISPIQSTFILGRWIVKSSILTQELVHKIKHKRGNGGLMALKLDMPKA